jgi:hypothetical protein
MKHTMTATGPRTRQPNRVLGMGAAPTNDAVSSALSCGFTQVPVIEYVTWTVDLPVPDADIQGTFGAEIDILQNSKSVPGVTSVDSSFVMNGLLQVDMLVVGFGIHAFAEPQNGSQIGNYVNPAPAAAAVVPSPDAFTQNDVTNGALGTAVAAGTTTITPAVLEWGVDAQNALWHMVNAYQFIWRMQQRYELINELAADVAYFGSYAEAVGAGSSSEAFQRLVRRVNNKYASLGAPGIFEPINLTRVGSTTTLTTTNKGMFHATRAYDLLPVTWGGLRAQGMTGSIQPFRRLFKPVLLEKGIPIGMYLQLQDEYHGDLMQQYLSQSDSLGGTVSTISIGPATSGYTSTSGSEALELTLDATPVAVAQQVQTDRVIMKGGALQMAILIKGFEIWAPWMPYIKGMVSSGAVATPATMAQAATLQ